MISKQKLLQWIEERQDVYGGPYDDCSEQRAEAFKSKVAVLELLKRDIKLGEFVVDNGEEV